MIVTILLQATLNSLEKQSAQLLFTPSLINFKVSLIFFKNRLKFKTNFKFLFELLKKATI